VRVLVTGGFGNVGSNALRACLARGDAVRVLERDSRPARRVHRSFDRSVEVIWGDLTTTDLAPVVAGCQTVIHAAFMLWPITEHSVEQARAVNVDGTRRLLDVCRTVDSPPRFVFTSSVAVFGHTQKLEPPRRVGDPMNPVDTYSTTKVEAERLVQGSGLPWVILRLSVAPPVRPAQMSGELLRELFAIRPDNRLEFVHPADVGLALANACRNDEALGQILLIGGGPENRMRALDFNNGIFGAFGLGSFPAGVFGAKEMYTDWLDTDAAQRMLEFQRHSFADYLVEARAGMGVVPRLVRPLAPLLRWALIKGFAPRQRAGG
jgi:nucleoside-diphosphate-sugar epimerase